jgi:multiple sugar transport system permease protein/raffinose/stachyose/melibiose transport system permease protein
LQFFQGQNVTDYGPLMAGYLIASLPLVLLFTFLSKYFLAGVQGGVPGAH